MPELVYIRSYILSAIGLASRLKDMENLVEKLELALASANAFQRIELMSCYKERFGENILNLSAYRLTDSRRSNS